MSNLSLVLMEKLTFKYIIKSTALIFFILAVIFVVIILLTVRNGRRLTYLIESNIKYLSK